MMDLSRGIDNIYADYIVNVLLILPICCVVGVNLAPNFVAQYLPYQSRLLTKAPVMHLTPALGNAVTGVWYRMPGSFAM